MPKSSDVADTCRKCHFAIEESQSGLKDSTAPARSDHSRAEVVEVTVYPGRSVREIASITQSKPDSGLVRVKVSHKCLQIAMLDDAWWMREDVDLDDLTTLVWVASLSGLTVCQGVLSQSSEKDGHQVLSNMFALRRKNYQTS